MSMIEFSLFIVFTVIVWVTANQKNSSIVRPERYEYTFSSGSKLLPKTTLLCCFPQTRRNLGHLIQQATISCKITCDLSRPTGALLVRNIPNSEPSFSIQKRPQFDSSDGYGQFNLIGSIPSGDVNEKSRRIELQIPFPPIPSKFTASWGTVQEIPIPRKFRQYEAISNDISDKIFSNKYKIPVPISSGYASNYYSEGTNIDSTSYRRLQHVEIPSISSGDASYMTRTTRKSITSYIRPTDMTTEDKQSHTFDTTAEANYLNPNPQIQVVASELTNEINDQNRKRKVR